MIQIETLTVRAGMRLWPADHVGELPDGRYGYLYPTKLLGIVDPLRPSRVDEGKLFTLWLYPEKEEKGQN